MWTKRSSDRQVLLEYWKLAWPAALEALLLDLLMSVDLVMVRGLGAAATSSIGVFSQPRLILLCFARAFAVALTARISMLWGSGRGDEITPAMKSTASFAAVVITLLVGIAALELEWALRATGATDDYIDMAMSYGRPMIIAVYVQSLFTVLQGGLLGVGRTKEMMAVNVTGHLVKIALSVVLIYQMGLGVFGAGLGTLAGGCVTLALTVAVMMRPKPPLTLRGSSGWAPSLPRLRPMGAVWSGSLAELLLERVGMFLFTRLAAGLGVAAFAAHIVCTNITDLCYMPGLGLGKAAMSCSGYWYGAGDVHERKRGFRAAMKVALAIGTSACVMFMIFRQELMALYHSDPEVVAYGVSVMPYAAIVCIPSLVAVCTAGVLRATGHMRYVAVYSLFVIAIMRPILTYLFIYPLGMGLGGAWAAMLCDQCMRAMLAVRKVISSQRAAGA